MEINIINIIHIGVYQQEDKYDLNKKEILIWKI
jgi:hypothetical protein